MVHLSRVYVRVVICDVLVYSRMPLSRHSVPWRGIGSPIVWLRERNALRMRWLTPNEYWCVRRYIYYRLNLCFFLFYFVWFELIVCCSTTTFHNCWLMVNDPLILGTLCFTACCYFDYESWRHVNIPPINMSQSNTFEILIVLELYDVNTN